MKTHHYKEIIIWAKAWTREEAYYCGCIVMDGEVLVWDPVGRIYTKNHVLSPEACAEVRKLAEKA